MTKNTQVWNWPTKVDNSWLQSRNIYHTTSLWCAIEISYQSMIKFLMNMYTTYTFYNTFTKISQNTRHNTHEDENSNTRGSPRINTSGRWRHQSAGNSTDCFGGSSLAYTFSSGIPSLHGNGRAGDVHQIAVDPKPRWAPFL